MSNEPLKITSFEIENVKKVRAVSYRPAQDGLTVIGGRNGQGKTSVLDAIAYALGGEKFRPSELQNRDGMNPASIKVTLSNGIVVERSGKNASLKVTDPTGMRAGQKLLDAVIEVLALNLPKFLEASGKDKAKTLLRTLGIEDQLDALDKEEKKVYDDRTLAGREADEKKKYADGLPEFADVPEELLNVADLTKELTEILAWNADRQAKINNIEKLKNKYDNEHGRLESMKQRKRELEEEIDRQTKITQEALNDYSLACQAGHPEERDTAEVQKKIDDVQQINAKITKNLEKSAAMDVAKQKAEVYQALTRKVEEVRQKRMDLLKSVAMPLDGLSVEDGELVYKGAKWDCMSSMEQVLVGISICHAVNPKCGFVLLDKLECFDSDQLASLDNWMAKLAIQGIATRVSQGDECTLIIEDGVVREDDEDRLPEPEEETTGKIKKEVELEEF